MSYECTSTTLQMNIFDVNSTVLIQNGTDTLQLLRGYEECQIERYISCQNKVTWHDVLTDSFTCQMPTFPVILLLLIQFK